MKIRTISIDGFGVWSELQLPGFVDSLNVLYGPNEAGKTTLMQFVRAILYGFSPDRRDRYLPPVYGGRAGGALSVAGADGTYTVRRYAVDGVSDLGALSIAGADEGPRDVSVLNRLLGNIDEAVYRNVFAIGLREIQELGALSDTDAAQWLYKLAAGTDRVSLVDVTAELAKARDRLLADASPGSIPQLLAERDRLRREANQQTALRRYAELAREHSELSAQIEAAEQEAQQAEASTRLTEVAAAVYDKWHARRLLEERLAAARTRPRLDSQTLSAFEAVSTARERTLRRRKILARKHNTLRRDIAALGLDEALWRRRTRIESLLDEEQWITALDAERVALAAKLAAAERERAALCVPLGIDPAAPPAMGGATDDAWRRLKPLAIALRNTRRALTELTSEAEGHQKAAESGAKALSAALSARGATSLKPLMERAGELVSRLRRRVQCDDRLAELEHARDELAEQSRELLARTLLPGWALVALGIVFVLGIVTVAGGLAAGFLLPRSWFGQSKWALAALGVLAAGGAAAAKVLLERAFDRRSKTALAQLETLGGQIEEAKHERDTLDAQLPAGGGPLLARLQAAEKDQAAIEALVPLESARQSTADEAAEAEERREQAHQEYTEARHRWRHALTELGLSPRTPPSRAREMAELRKQLDAFDSRLSVERGELVRRQSVIDAFNQRLVQLRTELELPAGGSADPKTSATAGGVSEVGRPTPAAVVPPTAVPPANALSAIAASGLLVEPLRALRERLRQQTALVVQRKTLRRKLRRLLARRHKTRLRLRQCDRKIDAILDEVGVADAAALRRRAQETVEADAWANDLDALSAEIAALRGPQFDEAELAKLVAAYTRPQLDEQWKTLTDRVRQLREQSKVAHEQRGRNEFESQTLRDDRQAGRARLQLGAVERQLREATERWQVLAVADALLRGVRRRYERERQPETLREASGYLERLTEGRYCRVWTPIEGNELRVDDADGRVVSVDVLSCGTREQLFLSLRLALAAWYARRGIDLPLVLDDVLVNFDARRAEAAARLLADFAAAGHQVLLFTCHRHVYEMFRTLGVAARVLPANPGRKGAVEIFDEQNIPQAPAVMPPPPAPTRTEPFEVIVPAPQPTNGHRAERDVVPEPVLPPVAPPPPVPPIVPVAPIVAVREAPRKPRAHVKFDCLHGPRGPFATALWHERITFEVTGDVVDEPEPDADEPWFDVTAGE